MEPPPRYCRAACLDPRLHALRRNGAFCFALVVFMFIDCPKLSRPCEKRLRQDSGPIGSAWRVSEDKEKAKRRAERLGLTIQGDFEVAVGTAGINKEKPAPQGNPATSTIPVPETPEGGNERPAKPDSLDGGIYGEEMSAIAMGDHSSLQGPGEVMSMGSSSYVTDMVRRFCNERGVLFFRRRWRWYCFFLALFFSLATTEVTPACTRQQQCVLVAVKRNSFSEPCFRLRTYER